jgi:DNA replication regulator SLD2
MVARKLHAMISKRILRLVHYFPPLNLQTQLLTIPKAGKYKEYNKIRDLLSGKAHPPAPANKGQTPRKRKLEDKGKHGVSKRQRVATTPSRASTAPWEVDPYDSPSLIRNLFTPSKKILGPTPQKDGRVLGLFDLLEENRTGNSPSKVGNDGKLPKPSVLATPGKPKTDQFATVKHSRTPASSSKRFMLDAFATPLKNRDPSSQGGKTPSSVSKLHFSTPSFLRRDNHRTKLPVLNENEESLFLSPEMVRVPRKPLVRGLSSMLAGLRKMEDEAADEDLEALREMEMEMEGGSNPTPKPNPTTVPSIVLVEESQPGFPLGGFDDEAQFDSEPEEFKNPTLGRDGQPLKAYKKKGQKRTTRKVNMKPTRSKPQAMSEPISENSDDQRVGNSEPVPETQVDETIGFVDARNFDSDSQSEYTASEGGTRYRRPNQAKKNKSANKDGKIKTAARKVNAMAHQNFKRLKLRNSGAKGGPGHNSRFRRKK